MTRVPAKRSLTALYNMFTNNPYGRTTNEDLRDLAYSCYTGYTIVEHTGSGATEIDLGENVSHKLTLTANTILSFSNPVEGRIYRIEVNASTYTLTWPTMLWVDGDQGAVTTNGKDLLILFYTGSYYLAKLENNYESAETGLQITYPNGSEILYVGDICNITWTPLGIGHIQILYSIDSGSNYTEIVSSVSATFGTYAWTIPMAAISTEVLIKIIGVEWPTYYDVSDGVFEVRAALSNIWTQVAPQYGEQTAIRSLCSFSSNLYGGAYPGGLLLKWNGVSSWSQVAGQLASQTGIYSLCAYGSYLFGGTYPNGKLFKWDGVSAWSEVADQLNSQTSINTLLVFESALYAGTSPGGRLFRWNDIDAWEQVAAQLESQNHVYKIFEHDGQLYGVTGNNGMLFRWNKSNAWLKVADQLNSQVDVLSGIDFNDTIYGGTSPGGRLFE